MLAYRDSRAGRAGRVEVAFTDATLDLQHDRPGFAAAVERIEAETGAPVAWLRQVHGADVVDAGEQVAGAEGDALVADASGVVLMVRAADCVPLLLADPDAGVVGAAHAGRPGMVLDVAGRTVAAMRARGATRIVAWIGPHVCGGCYEVPEPLRAEVSAVVPAARAETTWGTPALDIAAGVRAQVEAASVEVGHVGPCTREDPRWHSYRRDGAAAGRHAGLVWLS